MNNSNNTAAWIIGIIVVLVIIVGGWWLISQQNANSNPANSGVPAQTTTGTDNTGTGVTTGISASTTSY